MPEPVLPPRSVARGFACAMLPAFLLLLVAFALPEFNLTGGLAAVSWGVALSASKYGCPLVALLMTVVLVAGAGRGDPAEGLADRRGGGVKTTAVVVAVLLLVLGGGAYVNEHLLKPRLAVARPNIEELSRSGVLAMTPEEFYALGDKVRRRAHLRTVLAGGNPAVPALHPLVYEHWLEETGFSFPSGHSLAAMTTASFFLAMALRLLSGPWLWASYLLVPWALAVCFSRPILRVHSAADVFCGAVAGMAIGGAAYLAAAALLGGAAPKVEPERL